MTTSTLADVQNQVQSFWAPVFTKELRASLLLGSLVNKQYQGEIKRGGDTVYVSQINKPTGQLLTIGTDADTFESQAVSTSRISIQANKRAVASYEFEDVIDLQSQLANENPEVMASLRYSMEEQINTYLYSLVNPSTSSPDHLINGVTDMNASQLSAVRVLAAQAKWPYQPGWYGLLDPQYYGDVIDDTTLASSDFGATDSPMIGGQLAIKRFGFNLLEDNSRSADFGLFFHPDFMHLVTQTEVQIKISDKHPLKQFGVVMSVDLIFGAALGIAGNVKHIKVYNS